LKKIIRITTVSSTFRLLTGQISFLNNYFEVICISSPGHHLADLEKNEGAQTMAVKIQRGLSPLDDIISVVKLYKVFKKENPWLVHSISPKAGLLAMMAAYFAGVENRVHTFTGLLFPTANGLKKRFLLTTDKLTCYFATHIIPEGFGVKNDLIKHQITDKKLEVLGFGNINGIDLEYFKSTDKILQEAKKIKDDLQIKNNDFLYVFVGRIVGDKGLNELIQSFCSINKINKSVKLILVGPFEGFQDPIKMDTKKLIDSNDSIFHVGYQKDVRPYLAASDVFVFPSYREGVPNSVIQACAMDLPCIVTDINGCNEIIENNVNGIIIPTKSIDSLENAMIKIYKDKEFYLKLKSETRNFISRRYEQKFVWNKILEFYSKLN
jgi:glycosyltransferase involved in cell wall biosynthesis